MDLVWILIEADLEKRVSVQKYCLGEVQETLAGTRASITGKKETSNKGMLPSQLWLRVPGE